MMAPWVLKDAVDDLYAAVTDAKLIFYGTLILGIAVAGGLARFAARRILIGASRSIEYDIRNAFYAHLQRLPLSYFHANRTGDLMSRATNDLNAVRIMVGPAVMYAFSTALTFLVALAFMFSLNPRLTLLALLPLPLVTVAARYFGRVIHERFEKIQAQLSDISAVTQEALAGVRVVRAYRQEGRETERFREANRRYVESNRGLIRLQGVFYPSMGLFMGIAELLVLWLGARDVIAGQMSVGELVAFNAYLAMLSWPMIAFGWVTNMAQRGRASWGRMLEVLEAVPAIADSAATRGDVRAGDITGAVEFRHLSFAYRDTDVLTDVSLTIRPGQTVAIVGRTGSGKSTLLALLARLHDPPPGTVLVDGIDVRELPLDALRGAIGFVPQEVFLFSDTISENVAFGARDDQDRVRDVAAIAQLDKDVTAFPHAYETRVGERGITLSGGQKQRTAIARALYVDPRILILDDALSAVDTHTEDEILKAVRQFRSGRTTLIVSHRISTVRDANHIVVLDGGRIIEQGTHETLVARGGAYGALHRQQLLEAELAAS
ncbi:MAG: ABC transporter ATP-binding protein [Acidobacteria bacterium]|nr:ABC transporter ATP-binding protein [Acidobacteriota bacterium]